MSERIKVVKVDDLGSKLIHDGWRYLGRYNTEENARRITRIYPFNKYREFTIAKMPEYNDSVALYGRY